MVINHDLRDKLMDGDLLITMACPVGCDFCIYSCLPSLEPQKWMPEETIRRVAEEYSKNDIGIRLCGGEPFFNLEKLKRCIDILLEYYSPFDLNIISSGVFAGTKANAIRNVQIIKDASFDRLIVSADRFHLPRVPLTKIINVIDACRELDIEIILRLSLDIESYNLIDDLAKIIVKYQVPMEVHTWGLFGRGENLDKNVLKNYDIVEKYIFRKITFYAKKYKFPTDFRYYLAHSAKNRKKHFPIRFFPTTFPNGNVYASSSTLKSEYMGNINNGNLSDMIVRFEKTFTGYFVLKSSSSRIRNYVPPKFEDDVDPYRNEPFVEDIQDEAIGRRFIIIDDWNDFDSIFKKMNVGKRFHGPFGVEDREFLISFRLKENDLWNNETTIKIESFLNRLGNEKIKFVLSRPLPPCLKVKNMNNQPKNCFECREMFTVQNEFIKFCEPLKNIFGPEIKQVENRNQIYNYFKSIHDKMEIPKICNKCIYHLRGQCDGLSLVK